MIWPCLRREVVVRTDDDVHWIHWVGPRPPHLSEGLRAREDLDNPPAPDGTQSKPAVHLHQRAARPCHQWASGHCHHQPQQAMVFRHRSRHLPDVGQCHQRAEGHCHQQSACRCYQRPVHYRRQLFPQCRQPHCCCCDGHVSEARWTERQSTQARHPTCSPTASTRLWTWGNSKRT